MVSELTEGAVVEGASALPEAPSSDRAPGTTDRPARGRGRDRGDRPERGERADSVGERVERSEERAEARPGEREPREPRNGRERSVYAARDPGFAASSDAVAVPSQDASPAPADDRTPTPERPVRESATGEGRRERRPDADDGNMRDERRAPSTSGRESQDATAFAATSFADPETAVPAEIDGTTGMQGVEAPLRRDGDERRGRSRDRYGRDRRERAPRDEAPVSAEASPAKGGFPEKDPDESPLDPRADASEAPVPATVIEKAQSFDAVEAVPTTAPDHLVSMGNNPQASPRSESVAVVPAPTPTGGLPKVQPFELPTAALTRIAEGSGLQWVNSNAERVAQVQAAIAAEPAAIHAPRERAPVVVVDEGPLVLVETKRNLAHTVLPFERPEGTGDIARH